MQSKSGNSFEAALNYGRITKSVKAAASQSFTLSLLPLHTTITLLYPVELSRVRPCVSQSLSASGGELH